MKTHKYLPLAGPYIWKGYTLDELRHHRAMTLIRIEIEKERIITGSMSTYNVLDYILIGFNIVHKISTIHRKFRQK